MPDPSDTVRFPKDIPQRPYADIESSSWPQRCRKQGRTRYAHVVTLIQEALCSGDARCVVEAVEKACRLKGLPVPHELYGEMTLESLIAVMAAIGLDLRTERLN